MNNRPSSAQAIKVLHIDGRENCRGLAQSTFRLLVDSAADGVIIAGREGAVLYANAAAASISSQGRQQLVGLAIGRPLPDGEKAEVGATDFDQQLAEAELRVVDVHWNGRPALLLLLRGAQAPPKEAASLLEQRPDEINRIAAGVAHELRNLIMAVQAGLRLVGMNIRQGAPLQEVESLLGDVLERTRNAETLSSQLLTCSRRRPMRPQVVNVNQRIASMATILAATLGKDVGVRTKLAEEVGAILVDPDQLDLALLNLAVNGRDAMEGGGMLTIESAAVSGEEACGQRLAFIRVTVEDTGTGMSPETKAKALEPFFTTKREGRGSGLGLYQVRGFVVASGGHLCIDSETGAGTKVHLFLPRSLAPEPACEERD